MTILPMCALALAAMPAGHGAVSSGSHPKFRALVVASRVKDHRDSIQAARPFFARMAEENGLAIDFTDDAGSINDRNLRRYRLLVMCHLAPFDMTPARQAALQKFIETGHGWVGIHAAGPTGHEFLAPGATYWSWFEELLGGVEYLPHPAYQSCTLVIQDRGHPATRNLPDKFEIADECHEWIHSPRGKVRVLAVADESTYHTNKPMGDHPIVWTNPAVKARNVTILMGHSPILFDDPSYRKLIENSVSWAAGLTK